MEDVTLCNVAITLIKQVNLFLTTKTTKSFFSQKKNDKKKKDRVLYLSVALLT